MFHADGRTDSQKLIVTFRNSANTPKIEVRLPCLNIASLRHTNRGRKVLSRLKSRTEYGRSFFTLRPLRLRRNILGFPSVVG
jgi:hypothetical protein